MMEHACVVSEFLEKLSYQGLINGIVYALSERFGLLVLIVRERIVELEVTMRPLKPLWLSGLRSLV